MTEQLFTAEDYKAAYDAATMTPDEVKQLELLLKIDMDGLSFNQD